MNERYRSEFIPKIVNFLKQRVFGENLNWTAKDNAKSICQIKQYAQDIDAEVIKNLLPNLILKIQK